MCAIRLLERFFPFHLILLAMCHPTDFPLTLLVAGASALQSLTNARASGLMTADLAVPFL